MLILLFGFFTPQENRNKLLMFYGALIATTVLGMVVGYSAGVVAGAIAGSACRGDYRSDCRTVFTGTSDIWVVSQYLVILVVACILSYLLFMWKNWWKERKQLHTV
jgi:hypothetical protein